MRCIRFGRGKKRGKVNSSQDIYLENTTMNVQYLTYRNQY